MIKCKDSGRFTCIGRSGKPKISYTTADFAINAAKMINRKNSEAVTKLVAYKCTHCHKYHLTSKLKMKYQR